MVWSHSRSRGAVLLSLENWGWKARQPASSSWEGTCCIKRQPSGHCEDIGKLATDSTAQAGLRCSGFFLMIEVFFTLSLLAGEAMLAIQPWPIKFKEIFLLKPSPPK